MRQLDVETRAAYDEWAATYDTQHNPTVDAARAALTALVGDAEGLDVVELGCGTGDRLVQLHGARSRTGFDLSEGMLAEARRRVPNATLYPADITQRLPLANEVADLVVFSLVLEHVQHLGPPLLEARRVLRRDGRIVVLEIHPDARAAGKRAHFDRPDGTEVRPPSHPHTRDDWYGAFIAAELDIRKVIENDRLIAWNLAKVPQLP